MQFVWLTLTLYVAIGALSTYDIYRRILAYQDHPGICAPCQRRAHRFRQWAARITALPHPAKIVVFALNGLGWPVRLIAPWWVHSCLRRR